MTLDRDAARALFDNAPAPAAAIGGATPFAAASPFGAAGDDLAARSSGRAARKGPDWRLIAPLGVASLCAVAVFVVAQPRDEATPGKTVAATSVARPLPMPVAPIETAEAPTPPAASIVAPPATTPSPVVKAAVRPAPARRPTPPRAVATAPSAIDASSDVSTRAPEPYMPTPSVVVPAPAPVTPPSVTAPESVPAPPPPIETPQPDPITPAQPDPLMPPQS